MASPKLRSSPRSEPDLALRVFDLVLMTIACIAPLFMGGRHPVGVLVYVALVVIAGSVWGLRHALKSGGEFRRTGLEIPVLLAVVIVGIQLIRLPPSLLAALAPLHAEVLPIWSEDVSSFGVWSTISLVPHQTRGQLVILLAHAMLFIIVMQRLKTLDDVERLVRLIAMAAISMAFLGLAQFLLGNGKFLWVYEHPSRTTADAVKGAFANENHFGSFLALGLAPLIAWAAIVSENSNKVGQNRRNRQHGFTSGRSLSVEHDWQSPLLWGALGVVVFAGMLTFSRGGVIAIAVSGAATVSLLCIRRVVGRKWTIGLGVALLVAVAAISIHGYKTLATQLETLGSGDLNKVDSGGARMNLWLADFEAVKRTPVFGTGAGSHAEIYPVFLTQHYTNEFTHAESSFVQILLETGVCGLMVAGATLLLVFRPTWLAFIRGETRKEIIIAAAVLGGMGASTFHAIWDFAWFLPSCMTMVILLSSCGCRLWQLCKAKEDVGETGAYPVTSFAWAVASILCIGLGAMMIVNRSGPALASAHWEEFLALRRAEVTSGESAGSHALLQPLARTLASDPSNARANVRMAAICMRNFEDAQQRSDVPLPLSQIRDAVAASNFDSLDKQNAWLEQVAGENRRWLDLALFHVHRALHLCPLQGEAYTLLSELAFLQGQDAIEQDDLLEQAMAVRPHDAHVLFAVGRDAALNGDDEKAITLWRNAFQRDRKVRRQIIEIVGSRVPAEEFIRLFSPEKQHLREMLSFYRKMQFVESTNVVALKLANIYENEAQASPDGGAAGSWEMAYRHYAIAQDQERALTCIESAVAAAPYSFDYRTKLARQLLACNRYSEAIEQLRWCRRHKPNDKTVERLWAVAGRGPVIEMEDEAAAQREPSHVLR